MAAATGQTDQRLEAFQRSV